MKKVLYFLLLLFCIPYSVYGINGNGSFASPFNGPLTADMNWSGTVYVNGDVTVNGFTLTISAGSTIIFLSPTADLIITGTGVLNASGSASSKIRFTADYNNNGTYGESGETWGHISFQAMNADFYTPSVINYCIIEYGAKRSGPLGTEASGGAIYTEYTYLTISNCDIHNNYAGFGGGIFVKQSSPHIYNCTIQYNTAGTTGGGMLFYISCPSLVENCLIAFNTSQGGGGGGGVFAGFDVGGLVFYNCTIVSNVSLTNSGSNIRLYENYAAPYPRFQNCIVWGSNSWIQYIFSPLLASNFTNCALQGGAASYSSCINISGTNIDPTGPNFINPVSGDFSFTFISPCMNAGLATGAPTTDILNRSRIGTIDIGAYELQYSQWTGATGTDWSTASNWMGNVDPAHGSGDVVIPSGLTIYPTGTAMPDFTIGQGRFMIMEAGSSVTLGNLTNNGTLRMNNSSAGMASLITSSYGQGKGAIEEIKLFLSGGGTKTPLTYKWHYISSPVTSLATSTFAPAQTLDLAQWIESRPATSLTQGWVAFDGYIYSTGGTGGPTFSTFEAGKAYDYYKNADFTYTFGGELNTSDVNVDLSYTSGNDNLYGFNLVGNPFPSGLDWDYIINNSYPANTSKSLYFTRNSVVCSYINGVGVPSDVNGIIPPMQGFFNKTYSAGNTLVLAAAARTHNNIHATYKKLEILPLVRLVLSDSTHSDETVIRFDNRASSNLDNDYDAMKMFIDPQTTCIYSVWNNKNYAINGLPFPDSSYSVPITVNIASNSVLKKITFPQIDGLNNYKLTLTDKKTGFVADLRYAKELTFYSDKGVFASRFVLKIEPIPDGTKYPAILPNSKFSLYYANNSINILPLSEEWDGLSGSVKVTDISGLPRSITDNIEFHKNSLISLNAPTDKGIYIIEIVSGTKRYTGKVVVKW